VLEGLDGILVGLLRKLVRSKMVAFAMRGGCGLMSVSCLVVIFGGAVVGTLWHG
jgi:hypothetical protein